MNYLSRIHVNRSYFLFNAIKKSEIFFRLLTVNVIYNIILNVYKCPLMHFGV